MSDTSAPAAQADVTLPIQINAQYVKDLSFENPNAPASLQPQSEAPRIEVNVDVQAAKLSDEEVYEVVLKINASGTQGEHQLFLAELTYGGLFTLKGIPQDTLHPVLLIECPRLLFPFARAIIAEATRDGGFPPLLIQPVDFAQMYRQGLNSRTEQAAPAPAAAPESVSGPSVLPPQG